MQGDTRCCRAVAALAHLPLGANSVKANSTTTSGGKNHHTVVGNGER